MHLQSKPHYPILDGLRGVAAVIVVIFHLLEPHAGGNHANLYINHAYLAVDFFFMLSGFVVAYAYDDRWGSMNTKDFLKRRLVRLHPLVVLGSLIGAATFYLQQSPAFPGISQVPVWQLLLVMLLGCTLLPLPIKYDIRGWQELHPLNGPAWSLYFEYIANLLYAFFLRRIAKPLLALLVFAAGCLTVHHLFTCESGDMIGGWALNWKQTSIGFTRMLFPFLAGLLLCRLRIPLRVRHGGFWWASLLLAIAFSLPRFGTADSVWMNALYECIVILAVFPLIVLIGAGGQLTDKRSKAVCKFLGDISYPIYITHFSYVLMYTGWHSRTHATLIEGAPYIALAFAASMITAYASLKLYDLPIRRWLTNRFLKK